jgi:hypothetical protein
MAHPCSSSVAWSSVMVVKCDALIAVQAGGVVDAGHDMRRNPRAVDRDRDGLVALGTIQNVMPPRPRRRWAPGGF